MFETLTVPSIEPCSLGRILDELDPESRKNLEEGLKLPPSKVPHRKVSRHILEELKVKVDPETISLHRSGKCRCSRA